MKKKVLSALLAVALFAGMAVPAFAATRDYNSSSQTGEDDEITSLAFAKDSYTVENGDTKNLLDELTAYAGTKKIVQDPTLEWSISDSIAFGVDSEGVVSNIGEDKGSAIVTVTANEGKVKATAKVVAAKSSAKNATGFKFAETKYTFTTTGASQEIKIAPTPSGAKFTQDQAQNLVRDFAASASVVDADDNTIGISSSTNYEDGKIKFDDDNNIVLNITADSGRFVKATKANTLTFETRLLKSDYSAGAAVDNDHYYSSTKRSTKIVVEEAKPAEKVVKTGTVNIEIGETVDLDDYIAFGPSSANYGKDVDWSLTLYNDDATTEDYAVQKSDDGSKIMGVAVGRLKAVATLKSDSNATAEVVINVLEKGAVKEGKLSASTAEISVGTQVKLSVSETKDGAKITWKIDNDNATIDPYEGASTIVRGKKAGTSVVTAYVDGKEVGSCTITVKAASTSTPSDPSTPSTPTTPPTNNAQTGDSLFSNLF